MNYRSFSDLSQVIRSNLYKLQPSNFDLIVGIPRSGMVPAYMIGLALNKNVMDFKSFLNNSETSKGFTRTVSSQISSAWEANRVLIVDDSISSGRSLKKVLDTLPKDLRKKVKTLAVYSSSEQRSDVDIFLEFVPHPRAFEWNIFHKDLMARACLDIDGVLCHDPSPEQNDDGENYIDFIKNARTLNIPTYEVHSLVTSRIERYRSQTEEWLSSNNVKYKNLVMLDLPSHEERRRQKAHVDHKACYYKSSGLDIFIESEERQALMIMRKTGKPVICTSTNRVYSPSLGHLATRNPKGLVRVILSKIVSLLPKSLKLNLKSMVRKMK